MPFLRRRGVMASESDMRRHTLHPNLSALNQAADSTATSTSDLPRKPGTIPDLPAGAAAAPAEGAPSATPGPAFATRTGVFNIPAPPATPPHDSPRTSSATMPSRETVPDRPDSPPIQDQTPKHRRFSMLRFRNASDSQLAARAKQQAHAAADAPPLPRPPPEIITTAPTMDINVPHKKQSRMKLSGRARRSGDLPRTDYDAPDPNKGTKNNRRKSLFLQTPSSRSHTVSFDMPELPASSNGRDSESVEDGIGTTLGLPAARMSESSRSERSDASYAMTPKSAQSTSSFFRLPRRKPKQAESLFPLSHLPQRGNSQQPTNLAAESSSSLVASTSNSVRASTSSARPGLGALHSPTSRPPSGWSGDGASTPPAQSPALAIFQKSNPSPATVLLRSNSKNSGQSSPTRGPVNLRGRSSTFSSLGRDSADDHLAPPNLRTSSSVGRKSFGDLLGLSRIRQNSEPTAGRQGSMTPMTPGSNASKNNSLQLPREPSLVLPERRAEESPAKYLARLEEIASRSIIAAALCKYSDQFFLAVLRSYMRGFSFFGDPMDMAIRKLLMEAELPKETQHIDRCLQAFANRYHECNPGIYSSPDQAYFIAFSLLILHTDVFNKNNKHKMQKADYLKNTRGEGIFDEILDVFYDNITYTPFIHVEDDFDENGERISAQKAKKKSLLPNGSPDTKKATKEPIDPYTLIIDGKLDILRPNLKDVMHLDDHYNYIGTAKMLNLKELQQTFFRTGVLQIVSARSRPDAFMSEKTAHNPEEAHPGIVDIKITKVGLLWRKEAKKKRTRSPWQEWGAILTGAQLYFFRNVAWVKNLMHQYESHIKHGNDGIPIIFNPPLEQFKPDALMSTEDAVALVDSTYRKHKNAFVYVRHGGFEEVLLADNEEEMNDWLAKLNYAAAFRTSGVRMRGVIGGGYDGQSRRAIRRLDPDSSMAVNTPSGEVTITRSQIDQKMARDILHARREIMALKVADADEKLEQEHKKLEIQLRNARHLQILAPIQPKTREAMLLHAARVAAQLKWVWMEIWKLKCHRDILLLDLEEERELLGLNADAAEHPISKQEMPLPSRQDSESTTVTQKQPHSPKQLAFDAAPSAPEQPDIDSPVSDVFQTPPTSATAPAIHHHENRTEIKPLDLTKEDIRKPSVASIISSANSGITPATGNKDSSSTVPEKQPAREHRQDEIDAGERDLLEKAGLIESDVNRSPEGKAAGRPIDGDDLERRDRISNGTPSDKNKMMRRSLQRTLREGAGHLSHHRSRKGKDPSSSAVVQADEIVHDTDMLVRGSGSFVVHGKKASVIDLGGDLQSILPDERIRQRKSQPTDQHAENMASAAGGDSASLGDYRSILKSTQERDRRESAGSANTATARSFRELHRKYSTARAAKTVVTAGGLTIPVDEDSDAAVSFSDGRRSPLPPIGTESTEDEAGGESRDDSDSNSDGDDLDYDHLPEVDRAEFFTPEPPPSPGIEDSDRGKDREGPSAKGKERMPSPTIQAVGA